MLTSVNIGQETVIIAALLGVSALFVIHTIPIVQDETFAWRHCFLYGLIHFPPALFCLRTLESSYRSLDTHWQSLSLADLFSLLFAVLSGITGRGLIFGKNRELRVGINASWLMVIGILYFFFPGSLRFN